VRYKPQRAADRRDHNALIALQLIECRRLLRLRCHFTQERLRERQQTSHLTHPSGDARECFTQTVALAGRGKLDVPPHHQVAEQLGQAALRDVEGGRDVVVRDLMSPLAGLEDRGTVR
jgi:hypothetical protein